MKARSTLLALSAAAILAMSTGLSSAQLMNPQGINGTGGGAGGESGSGSITDSPWISPGSGPAPYGAPEGLAMGRRGGNMGYGADVGYPGDYASGYPEGREFSGGGPIVDPNTGYSESRRRTQRNRSGT